MACHAAPILTQRAFRVRRAGERRIPGVTANIEQQFQAFKHSEPGHRFRELYERRSQSERGRKVAVMVVAGLVIATGVALMILPGPGIPVIVIGLAMIAQELQCVASTLDRLELKIRGHSGRQA